MGYDTTRGTAQDRPTTKHTSEEVGPGWVSILFTVTAIGWVAFQLYTAATGVLPALQQRAIHLTFAVAIVFLITNISKSRSGNLNRVLRVPFLIVSVVTAGYIVINHEALWTQGFFTGTQTAFGAVLIIVILEASRRIIGLAIPIIAIAAMLYAYLGALFTGPFGHKGYDFDEIIAVQALGLQGIYGIPLGVIATFVFLFIMFAALFQVSGAGDAFMDVAKGLLGHVRGGPAKISVAGSAALGTISGSTVANVATSGPFTIPMMKKTGYKSSFAGGVEATASSGGQIAPPLMGASAFLIAEVLAIPYWQVALGGVIPALVYFLAIFIAVDLEAARNNVRGLPKNELPNPWRVIKSNWPVFFGPIILVVALVGFQTSPMRAAIISIAATFIVMMLSKNTRIGLRDMIELCRQACKGSLEATIACAAVGIVIGVMTQTGLGVQLSGILVTAASGNLLLLLLLTAVCSLVLGMGLPTIAAYLVLSVTVAPALIEYGIVPLAAHMFIFYFGVYSNITPPVALASLVASSIAEAKFWPTAMAAVRLALPSILIPFVFVYSPGLLFAGGSPAATVLDFITAIIGTAAIASGAAGYARGPLRLYLRVIALAGGVIAVLPGLTALVGLALIAFVLLSSGPKPTKHNTTPDLPVRSE